MQLPRMEILPERVARWEAYDDRNRLIRYGWASGGGYGGPLNYQSVSCAVFAAVWEAYGPRVTPRHPSLQRPGG